MIHHLVPNSEKKKGGVGDLLFLCTKLISSYAPPSLPIQCLKPSLSALLSTHSPLHTSSSCRSRSPYSKNEISFSNLGGMFQVVCLLLLEFVDEGRGVGEK